MSLQVLLVEDDEEDYLLTCRLLRNHTGASYEVTWAQTLEAGLEELDKPFDVCLVDYRLGAHTGLELIQAGVAKGFAAPMILLTGRGDHDVDVKAMQLGAADYLVKDQISAQLLERVIRHSIERLSARASQKHGDIALRESEQQYREIVEATSDGIIKLDLVARIVVVNRRFAEMLGYTPREMLGTAVLDYMSPPSKLDAVRWFEQCARGMTVVIDGTFRHRDGSEIWCSIAGTQLLDVQGVHVGNLGVVRDETERRKLHAELMVSDRMASVGTLAAGVAHEINNPLAVVIANLEFIGDSITQLAAGPEIPNRDAWVRTEITEPLRDAREASHRVRLIVRDLKLFSRSPVEDLKATVDVKAIMESSLRMAWNEIRHRARLVKNYSPLVGVCANEARLGQVFLNLLVNAAQAIPEGRAEHNEIRVDTRMEGGRAVIEVSDSGAGIPAHVLPRIFDAFFTTKAVGVGTGLGLAICQRLVTDMAGELTVQTEEGKGTKFRVSLPVATEPQLEITAPAVKPTAETRRGRILVVDDEAAVARGLQRILFRHHDVVAVDGAKEALTRCLGGEEFDLILCDLMMPDMTGMELHRELARSIPAQAGRMIFMTGNAFTAEARRFLAESMREHLEKPFDPINLRAIIRRYLQ